MDINFGEIIEDIAWRTNDGSVDWRNPEHISILRTTLRRYGVPEQMISEVCTTIKERYQQLDEYSNDVLAAAENDSRISSLRNPETNQPVKLRTALDYKKKRDDINMHTALRSKFMAVANRAKQIYDEYSEKVSAEKEKMKKRQQAFVDTKQKTSIPAPDNEVLFDVKEWNKIHKFANTALKYINDIKFENAGEKTILINLFDNLKNNKMPKISDKTSNILKKYFAKANSPEAKIYITIYPNNFTKGKHRPKIEYSTAHNFVNKITDIFKLHTVDPNTGEQVSKDVISISSKKFSPEKINDPIELSVESTFEKNELKSLKILNNVYKTYKLPDVKELTNSFVQKFKMDSKEANDKAKNVISALNRRNTFLNELYQLTKKDGNKFKVCSINENFNPTTPEGRTDILKNYPLKLHKSLIEEIGDSGDESVHDILNKLKNLSNMSGMSYEDYKNYILELIHSMRYKGKEKGVFHPIVPTFSESLLYLILIKKGLHCYLPASPTNELVDLISFNNLSINPTKEDYIEQIADSAQNILLEDEDIGGQSVKVEGGAKPGAIGVISKSYFNSKYTRKNLNNLVRTHDYLFSNNRSDAENDISDIRSVESILDESLTYFKNEQLIDDKVINKFRNDAKIYSEEFVKTYSKKTKFSALSSDDWARQKPKLYYSHLVHDVLAYVYNKDIKYQTFSNFIFNVKAMKIKRTNGTNVLCTVSPNYNPGFSRSQSKTGKWYITPENRYGQHLKQTENIYENIV